MDKYYVYRPLIDLIGFTEGTAPPKGRGYNETLAYGNMLDGKITGKGNGVQVELVSMTLNEVDGLQTKMLRDPDNKRLNSSAVGWGQIVRTTLRSIRKTLSLTGNELYDADMQDRLICYLLGVRGIDKYLTGRLKEDTLINNLAKEWASFPTTKGKGHYGGQHAAVSPDRVRIALAEVRKRHAEGQPVTEKPVVPVTVEKEVRQKTNWGAYISTVFSAITAFATWAMNADPQLVIVIIGFGVLCALSFLLGGKWIVRRIRVIKQEIEV